MLKSSKAVLQRVGKRVLRNTYRRESECIVSHKLGTRRGSVKNYLQNITSSSSIASIISQNGVKGVQRLNVSRVRKVALLGILVLCAFRVF